VSRRRALALGLLAVLAALLIAAPLALRAAGRYLVESDPLERADAIVVLTGSYPDRILEAVDLYKAGWAPRIILCREPQNAGFRRLDALGVKVPQLFELNRSVAEQLGVPAQAIAVVDRPAGSTFSEAELVLEYVLARGDHSILLVTSKYHSRRAARIYRHLAAGRVHVITCPARDDDFRADGWWHDRASIRRVVIEYQKLLTFLLFDRWRLLPVGAEPTPSPTAG
jgi:uncharacterized SAM-binding protein YcdF (DUF218 family)